MVLHVTLLDGFQDDSVTVIVGGRQVYRKSGVTTDLTISHADSFDVEVDQPTVTVEVRVEGGPRASAEVDVANTPYLAARASEGGFDFRQAAEPFPML